LEKKEKKRNQHVGKGPSRISPSPHFNWGNKNPLKGGKKQNHGRRTLLPRKIRGALTKKNPWDMIHDPRKKEGMMPGGGKKRMH